MIILKMALCTQSHHAQSTAYGSLSWRQNGTEQEDTGILPDTQRKQGLECKEDGCQLGRKGGHKTLCHRIVFNVSVPERSSVNQPPRLQMDKVELRGARFARRSLA